MTRTTKIYRSLAAMVLLLLMWGCVSQQNTVRQESKLTPAKFSSSTTDSSSLGRLNWKEYFADPNLTSLIDTALRRNQELNITLQEIEIRRNEIRARKGEYLPFVGLQGGAGVEKVGEFTRSGAVEKNLEVKPGTKFPEPLGDYTAGAVASWELDVWKKLRNAKKSASMRYLSSVEGKNFMVTNLVAEIADSYYELMALDNQLQIIQRNIDVQTDALQIVRQQKDAAKVTQLAINRFEAQLLNTTNLQYAIKQRITETENRLSYLTGGFPRRIVRNSAAFNDLSVDSVHIGIPSQLLINRPDIRQAEFELAAAKLDVKVARAYFYPSFRITGRVGFQAFNPSYLIKPESLLYGIGGDLMAPLVNRNAIRAAYNNASAQQIQKVFDYERTILNAYVEVENQLAKVRNYSNSYNTKAREVEILRQSIDISNSLFRSARADYLEVLLTQREALGSRMELVEIKMQQLNAKVDIYRALGGGWR